MDGVKRDPIKLATIQPPRSFAVQPVDSPKRKREEGGGITVSPPDKLPTAKRKREDKLNTKIAMDIEGEERKPTKSSSVNMDKVGISQDTLRDAIESQLSLEILLKHDELRLINQEMAKCQIALEQLRRCHLIPFPNAQGTQSAMQSISNGTGPAIMPPHRDVRPPWAAPYGVSDGPYTRHYAKWLIPDPSFDGMQIEWERNSDRARAGNATYEGGRTTRHSFAEGLTPTSKVRTHRGASGQKLQALPSGYTQSKENAGPSILKRADGQMVKLVCIDCRRENFGSTQGFINHCRIAHRREFKSHEEAAVQSGVPIELDEVGGIVGEEKAPSVATGLVHPLIRNAPTDRAAYAALLSRINDSLNMFREGKLAGVTSIPGTPASTPHPARYTAAASYQTPPSKNFVASSETPFLSNLLKSRGFDGNLGEIVGEAKKVVDFEDFSSHSEESDNEKRPDSTSRSIGGLDGSSETLIHTMRMPARAAMSPAPLGRPGSSKGPDGRNARKPSGQSGISPRLAFATPINTSTAHTTISTTRPLASHNDHISDEISEQDTDALMLDGPSIVELSPNTVISNNAPSLVSDDGEYEDGDDDAESSMDGSEGEDEGSDVAEINFEDVDSMDKVVPRTALRHRPASGSLRKEDKHVTFVSPVKEGARTGRSKK